MIKAGRSRANQLNCLCFVLSAVACLVLGWTGWTRLRMPYNEAGRYFAGDVVYHQHSVLFYGLAAFGFLVVTLFWGYRAWKGR